MKTLPHSFLTTGFALAIALMPTVSAENPAQNAELFYRQGQAAERSGDPVAARKAYTAALQANPRHAAARYSLGQLRLNAASIAAKGHEAKFGEVMVPEFKLDAASLSEALAALQAIVEKESKGEVAPNFVVQDPGNKLTNAKITLVLRKVPARGVLRYVLDQAGAKSRHDEHAIVITPR